ncbi:uncharacterized protein PF11_0207-like [Stegastes partitus]|uniref:Uncharacterized protein PF11_0207-like n=1 Tax=Stegastes partitus TaxID=144197 RepID=A0A9Y4KJP3_9TELE|nr:PREDICTED: uncharacterized protein PF11_0207-like [Stegastes partitus]
MAAIEEIIEGAEESIEAAGEEVEGMPEELREEIELEVAQARSEVVEFSRVAETLRAFSEFARTNIPKVAKFIGETVAIGVILWAVNVCLDKLFNHRKPEVKKRRDAIKALTSVIKTQTDLGNKTMEWMKEHKDEIITLEGIEVPLEATIAKYITPVSEAVTRAFKTAASLQYELDGKVQYNIPTGEDMREFLTAGDAFLKGFSDLVAFNCKTVQKIKQLASFPVKQADVDLLAAQMKAAKALPLW